MLGDYVNRLGGVCGTGTDRGTLPEAELWTQVILQAIKDLDGRTSLTPRSAKDSARGWFASESDAVSSFNWACQIIDVDPDFIRSQLAKKLGMKNPVEVMASIAQGAKSLEEKKLTVPGYFGSRRRASSPKKISSITYLRASRSVRSGAVSRIST